MQKIDLVKLAEASATVKFTQFGSLDAGKVEAYLRWVGRTLASKISPETSARIVGSFRSYLSGTVLLMSEGIDAYLDWVIKGFDLGKSELYPIISEKWKSDAWLTGLLVARLSATRKAQINPANVGYAVSGSPSGDPSTGVFTGLRGKFLLLIDDASYSGTQAHQLFVNCAGLRARGMFAVFAGATKAAKTKVEGIRTAKVMSPLLLESSRFDEVAAIRLHLPGYAKHIELDPNTLVPKPTTSEFLTFDGITNAVLPYKIPDSVSVATHLYCALGYAPAASGSSAGSGENKVESKAATDVGAIINNTTPTLRPSITPLAAESKFSSTGTSQLATESKFSSIGSSSSSTLGPARPLLQDSPKEQSSLIAPRTGSVASLPNSPASTLAAEPARIDQLFTGKGSVDYREILPKLADSFATKLA